MKAQVLYGVNDLRYEDVKKPTADKGEVIVKVEAVGICGSDIPRIYETGAHRHPLIPGHEFAGTVCEVGEEEYSDNQSTDSMSEDGANEGNTVKEISEKRSLVGKRVGVFPLIPCGKCGPCKNKQYEMCRNYNYLGSRCDGGFAEYVRVPVWNLIDLPDNVSFEDAAMLEPTAVAAHAMRRLLGNELCARDKIIPYKATNDRLVNTDTDTASIVESENMKKTIAVIGLGTIGLLLVMHLINEFGNNDSYEILVVGNKEFQKNKAVELGISPDNYCDSKSENTVEWIMDKTGGRGAYAVFECVGKNETCLQAIEAAAPAGRVMLLGNPASDIKFDKKIYWKILRNQLTVLGTWNSSFTKDKDDDWNYVIDKLAKGLIKPSKLISHRLALSNIESGLHIMRDKTEDYVKVMMVE